MYQLKNKELQSKLEDLTGGKFVDALNRWIEYYKNQGLEGIQVNFSDKWNNFNRFTLYLDDDDIEFPYNPKAWNNFPEVTPPQGVMMRVELSCNDIGDRLYGAYWNPEANSWVFADGECMSEYENKCVVRFRLWDDPDEEDEK